MFPCVISSESWLFYVLRKDKSNKQVIREEE